MNNILSTQILLPLLYILVFFCGIAAFVSKSALLPLLIFFGIAFVGFFFYNARLCLFFIIFLRIQLDVLWWLPIKIGPLNLLAAFTGGVSVLGTVLLVMRFSKDIERHPSIHYFIFINALLILGAVRAIDSLTMIDEFFRIYSPLLILFLCVSLFNQKGDWKRLLYVILLSSLIPTFLSAYHLLTGQMTQLRLDGANRLLGGYHNLRNHALMMFLFSCCGVFFVLFFKKTYHKTLMLLFCCFSLLCIYFTHTRATLIVYGVFLITFLFISKRKILMVFVMVLGTAFVIFNPNLFERFSEFSRIFLVFFDNSPQEQDLSSLGSGRYSLWSDSLNTYTQKSIPDIVLGLGFGSHWILTQDAYNPFIKMDFVDTHNDMLRILYQIGPFGLIFFCLILFNASKTALWINKHANQKVQRDLGAILFALSIAIALNNIFSNGINSRITFGWCFWTIMSVSYILKRELINEKLEQKNLQESSVNAS